MTKIASHEAALTNNKQGASTPSHQQFTLTYALLIKTIAHQQQHNKTNALFFIGRPIFELFTKRETAALRELHIAQVKGRGIGVIVKTNTLGQQVFYTNSHPVKYYLNSHFFLSDSSKKALIAERHCQRQKYKAR